MDASNTIYTSNQDQKHIHVWTSGNSNAGKIIFGNLSNLLSLFVTLSGDVFASTADNDQIQKWSLNATDNIETRNRNGSCSSVFVDLWNTIYCSIKELHQVLKKALNDSNAAFEVAAGNSSEKASAMDRLNEPHGIFVDTNLDLYVADCGNNRIQLFRSNNRTGTTVAGNSLIKTSQLRCPTSVALNADKSLFIVDRGNHRIVRTIPEGFECIIGCSRGSGSGVNQLNAPMTLAFDSFGNVFVADTANHRIQRYDFQPSSCCKSQIVTKRFHLSSRFSRS